MGGRIELVLESILREERSPCSIGGFLISKIGRKMLWYGGDERLIKLLIEDLLEAYDDYAMCMEIGGSDAEFARKLWAPLIEEMRKLVVMAPERDLENCRDFDEVFEDMFGRDGNAIDVSEKLNEDLDKAIEELRRLMKFDDEFDEEW